MLVMGLENSRRSSYDNRWACKTVDRGTYEGLLCTSYTGTTIFSGSPMQAPILTRHANARAPISTSSTVCFTFNEDE